MALSIFRITRPAFVAAISGLTITLAIGVCGAQHKQTMVIKDDGHAPDIRILEHPDFAELRQPDFVHRDLPIFKDRLVLSAEQLAALERLLEDYLAAFEKLADESLPKLPNDKTAFLVDGEGGPILKLGDKEASPDLEGPGDFFTIDAMEGDLPEGMGIGVDVRVAQPVMTDEDVDAAAGPDGGASVSVKFQSPDGQELPEEVRKKLEESAAQIAEKIKKQVEEQMAQGGQEGAVPAPFMGPAAGNIEEMQAYHEEMNEKAEDFRIAKANLRQQFVMDVQGGVLAEPQIERWPALERALLRAKRLPKGRLSGERTDLLKVLADLKLAEAELAAIAEQVESYELAMDSAIKVRDDYVVDAMTRSNQAMQDGDADKALSIVDRATALRIAVRNVNAQFADVIASLLPKASSEKFRATVLRTSYPRVYGRTYGQRMFESARKIEDLDPDIVKSIGELEAAYLVELAAVNDQIRQTIDRHQPQEARRPMEHLKSIIERRDGEAGADPGMVLIGKGDEQPISDAFGRRRELDGRYTKLVTSLLTPEQVAQLPKAPSHKPMDPVVIEIPSKVQ